MNGDRIRASNSQEICIEREPASQQAGEYGIVATFLLQTAMNHRQELKELLRRKSVVRNGEFTLSSGQRSDYYIDCKLTTLDPRGAFLTGYTILQSLKDNAIRADAIGGLSMGADPIVTAVAAVSYLEGDPLPGFLIRKERKAHGQRKQIEGLNVKAVRKVVIVDEVCTTGQSTRDAIDIAEAEGLEVVAVVSLVDREEGGSELLKRKYVYLPVFTARELLEVDSQSERGSDSISSDTRQATPSDRRPA